MKSTLLARLNLESGDSLVDDNTQIADMDLSTVEVEATTILNEAVELESAGSALLLLDSVAENLDEQGVSSIVVADILAPVATAVVATVDAEEAERTTEECVVSMESDDSKGVWKSIRERAIAIYQALKAAILRFWKWVKSFFSKNKQLQAKVNSACNKATIKAKSVPESARDIQVVCSARWTIDNQPVAPAAFIKNVDTFKNTFTVAGTKMFAVVREQYDWIKQRTSNFYVEMERIANLRGANESQEAAENTRQAANKYAQETEYVRKMMSFKGQHPVLGYYQVGGEGKMLLSTYDGEDKVVFRDKDQLIRFAASLHRLKTTGATNARNYERLQASAEGVIGMMDKLLQNLHMGPMNAKALRTELVFQTRIMTNSMSAIKEFVGSSTIQAVLNGAALVIAASNKAVA